jgi:hypothetical protein
MEQRDTRTIIEQVVAILVAEGGIAGIKAGVGKFRTNFPRAKVEIEGEPDDGGPMFRTGRMDGFVALVDRRAWKGCLRPRPRSDCRSQVAERDGEPKVAG